MNNVLKKRWMLLGNSFFILLFMGVSFAWSIFVVPLETTFGWTRAQTSLAFTLNTLCFSVGSILAGTLSKKYSFGTILKLAAIMIGGGFFLSSFVSEVWQIYITYSIICGTGIGVGYNCVVSSTPVWFPDKGGMATGSLLMGYALSTAIFGPVISKLISSTTIATTFKVLAVACFAGMFIGSLFLKVPSFEESKQLPEGPKKTSGSNNVHTAEMIKQPTFWVYYLLTTIIGGACLAVVNHLSPMLLEELKVSSALTATVISVVSICNGVGRLIWGTLSDKLSVNMIIKLVTACFTLAFVVLNVGYTMSSTVVFILGAGILYFALGGNAASCPIVMRSLYGNRTFSLNYSVLCTNAILAAFLPTLVGTLQGSSGSYQLPLIVLMAFGVSGAILAFIFVKLNKNEQ